VDVVWLIETGVFPKSAPRVTTALEARGQRWIRYEDGLRPSKLPELGACVVFWGSLGAAYIERVAATWTPGALGDIEQFRCTVYVPKLRSLLVNSEVVFASVRDLVDRTQATLAALGRPGRVFVRPDSALKPFAGRVVELTGLTRAALDHGYYYDDDQLLVQIAPARNMEREWRCVVADGEVVACCEYVGADRCAREGATIPTEVIDHASYVARAEWQVAPIYCVDVAEVDGGLAVLELNPFSGADLFGCEPGRVIDAANTIAQRLHVQATASTRARP
jgi:hypothetical protein